MPNPYHDASPARVRELIEAGEIRESTAGMAAGYVQCNLIVLEKDYADEFREFARSAGMERDVIFEEEPGEVHCWDFWDAYIARFVDRLPLKNRNFWRKWNDSQMWK